MIFDAGKRRGGKLRPLWRRRRKFRDLRLSSKLIVAYVLLTVIPMSLLGFISYRQYTRSIEEQNGEYMPKLLQQAGANIDNHVDELAALPEQLTGSDAVMSILRRESYASRADLNRDEFTVNSYLARTYLEGGNPDVLGVFILSGDRLFRSARLPYTGFDEAAARVYGQDQDLDLRDRAKIALPGEAGLSFGEGEPYILLLKQLYDTDNQRMLGTMFVAVGLSFMDDILREFKTDGDAYIRLQTAQGAIVYDRDPAMIGRSDPETAWYPLRSGSFLRETEGSSTLVSMSESAAYGWLLTYSVPIRELTERTDLVRNVTVTLFIGFAAITTVISILFALNVTRPLKRLSGLMREAELGRLRKADERELGGAEVGMLARSFNSMVGTIEGLIDKNVKVETSQKEAELYALQSQIHPHFIYNTLESIGMAAEEGERESVVKMVTLLGRMLRFSVGNRSKLVTVEEEVRHVRDYLTIQAFRFEDRLRFEVESSLDADEWRGLYTPKFILQPIVENAVKHGLEARSRLEVRIGVRLLETEEGGELVFAVRDNGPGMPGEKLAELRRELDGEMLRKADSGLGLANVHARIRLMFGEEYGLSIRSAEGEGTEVLLRIPVIRQPDLQNGYRPEKEDSHGPD